jgi:hypothetical protein
VINNENITKMNKLINEIARDRLNCTIKNRCIDDYKAFVEILVFSENPDISLRFKERLERGKKQLKDLNQLKSPTLIDELE